MLKDLALEQLDKDLSLAQFYSDEPSSWNNKVSSIFDFHEKVQELIEETSIQKGIETSADAYAQTITYGLFLVRWHSEAKQKVIDTADRSIPQNIPVIRTFFRNVSDEDKMPSNFSWIVDELINVLNATKIEKAMSAISESGLSGRVTCRRIGSVKKQKAWCLSLWRMARTKA